jgi:hypothetical protein
VKTTSQKKTRKLSFKGIGIARELSLCPHCRKKLEKPPSRKKKCPNCQMFIFVRTRSSDKKQVLVTFDEAKRLDAERDLQMQFKSTLPDQKKELESIRERLRIKFGKEPSDGDVLWGFLNSEIVKHAKNNDWGLYRNTRFEMAQLLTREGRFKQALAFLFEVCYLDLNEPNNLGGFSKKDYSLLGLSRFSPSEFSSLAPGVVQRINWLVSTASLSEREVTRIFLYRCKKIQETLKPPLSSKEVWPLIKKEILWEV